MSLFCLSLHFSLLSLSSLWSSHITHINRLVGDALLSYSCNHIHICICTNIGFFAVKIFKRNDIVLLLCPPFPSLRSSGNPSNSVSRAFNSLSFLSTSSSITSMYGNLSHCFFFSYWWAFLSSFSFCTYQQCFIKHSSGVYLLAYRCSFL